MRSECGLSRPVIRFHVHNGIVRTYVCLIEDEGLLFGASPFMLGLFEV